MNKAEQKQLKDAEEQAAKMTQEQHKSNEHIKNLEKDLAASLNELKKLRKTYETETMDRSLIIKERDNLREKLGQIDINKIEANQVKKNVIDNLKHIQELAFSRDVPGVIRANPRFLHIMDQLHNTILGMEAPKEETITEIKRRRKKAREDRLK